MPTFCNSLPCLVYHKNNKRTQIWHSGISLRKYSDIVSSVPLCMIWEGEGVTLIKVMTLRSIQNTTNYYFEDDYSWIIDKATSHRTTFSPLPHLTRAGPPAAEQNEKLPFYLKGRQQILTGQGLQITGGHRTSDWAAKLQTCRLWDGTSSACVSYLKICVQTTRQLTNTISKISWFQNIHE